MQKEVLIWKENRNLRRAKQDIKKRKKERWILEMKVCILTMKNEDLNDKVYGLNQEQEKVTGATKTLLKLNNLKGKMSNKVSTLYQRT